jgi:hypothetical protein
VALALAVAHRGRAERDIVLCAGRGARRARVRGADEEEAGGAKAQGGWTAMGASVREVLRR